MVNKLNISPLSRLSFCRPRAHPRVAAVRAGPAPRLPSPRHGSRLCTDPSRRPCRPVQPSRRGPRPGAPAIRAPAPARTPAPAPLPVRPSRRGPRPCSCVPAARVPSRCPAPSSCSRPAPVARTLPASRRMAALRLPTTHSLPAVPRCMAALSPALPRRAPFGYVQFVDNIAAPAPQCNIFYILTISAAVPPASHPQPAAGAIRKYGQ